MFWFSPLVPRILAEPCPSIPQIAAKASISDKIGTSLQTFDG